MQQIILKGYTGMGHMLRCTSEALDLSDYLDKQNIDNIVYHHEWVSWECFNNIYTINHKNYTSNSFNNTSNYPIVLVNTLDNNNLIDTCKVLQVNAVGCKNIITPTVLTGKRFFEIFSLTKKYSDILQQRTQELNDGNYIGVHFRGSDMCKHKNISKESFLEQCDKTIQRVKNENKTSIILLASDNQEVLTKYVDNKHIFTYSLPYELYKKGVILDFKTRLHCNNIDFLQNKFVIEDVCSNSALDFYLLINSKKFYPCGHSSFGWMVRAFHRFKHTGVL